MQLIKIQKINHQTKIQIMNYELPLNSQLKTMLRWRWSDKLCHPELVEGGLSLNFLVTFSFKRKNDKHGIIAQTTNQPHLKTLLTLQAASVALAGQAGGAVRVVLGLFGHFFFQEKK